MGLNITNMSTRPSWTYSPISNDIQQKMQLTPGVRKWTKNVATGVE
ncbi:hypothetical protein K3495_g9010 [Podosphaera aphanis]|nr:hypothetical protein K3495_g9010 [Podosphaera aphanis]